MTDPFDDLARRAGASLRSEAPATGPAEALRAGRRQQRIRAVGVIGAVAVLAVGGVALASRDDSSTVTADSVVEAPTTTVSSASTSASPATTATTTPTAPVLSEATTWALTFTGGAVGAASGEPIVVGLAAGAAEAPSSAAVNAMAEYVNAELGGILGRPIELRSCDGVADPTGCAEQLATDPAVVAVINPMFDNMAFEQAFAGRKPMLVADSSSYTAGVIPHLSVNQVDMAEWITAATLLGPATPEQRIGLVFGADVSWLPAATGVEGVPVSIFVPNPSDFSVDDMVQAIRSAGAENVAVVVVHNPFACEITEAAYTALGKSPRYVAPYWCVHEGWTIVGDRIDFDAPDIASGEATVVAAMDRYLTDPSIDITEASGSWLWSAADLLVLTHVVNQVGAVDLPRLDAALHSYSGPAFFGVGNASCAAPVRTPWPAGACTHVAEVSMDRAGATEQLPPIDLRS